MKSGKEIYHLLKLNRENGIKLLFEQYSKKLLTYATYNWKTDEDTAWDLVYKTIYKTADVIHEYEFENEQKFSSFIFKIFINYLRNYVRDAKTASQGVTEVALNDTIINSYPANTKTSAPITKSMKILQRELDKLEDWQRILLLMRCQEMPYSAISKFVDKPEEQLKVYYARLKKQITEKINEQLNIIKSEENAEHK